MRHAMLRLRPNSFIHSFSTCQFLYLFCVFLYLAGSEEVKDIEFTVTTLNCPQDSATPEHRRKFSSLRKTGALSKAVRSKISKSFYNNSSDNKRNDKTVITVAPLEDEKNNGEATETDANKLAMTTKSANTTTSTATKTEKHKKRSKLCQLL